MEPEGNAEIDKINVEVLLKEFNCSICLQAIEDCHVTKCGHVFCKDCIFEVINRLHKCPNCQSPLNDKEVFKNYHFNNLKKTIDDEREKAAKLYLDRIMLKKTASEENSELLNPIQDLFRKYLRSTIVEYQQKYLQNKELFKQKKEKLNRRFIIELNELQQLNSKESSSGIEKLVEEKRIKLEQEIKGLDEQLQMVNKYFLDSLEKSLKAVAPNPDLLDIRVAISVPSKRFKIEPIFIKPTDSVSSLKELIYENSLKTDDPMMEFDEKNNVIVCVPASEKKIHEFLSSFNDQGNLAEIHKLCQNLERDGIRFCGLKSQNLLTSLSPEPGSTLYLIGPVKLKSELRAECLTYAYVEGMVTDYYTCSRCNLNWICESCKAYCHKGHEVTPYLKGHKTTWACCYCVTKGACKALNKNNKNQKF